MYFSKLELIHFFIFTVVILILPHLAIVVRWNTPFDSSIITKGRVPETDILLVINPLSPCTELYTIRSQRRYLLGVLSDNRRGRVLFWWLWWWRDCNTYCYDHPAQDNIVGKAGDPIIYSRKKKKQNEEKWTRFIISRELTQTVVFALCIKYEFLLIAYREIIRALAWHELEVTV